MYKLFVASNFCGKFSI